VWATGWRGETEPAHLVAVEEESWPRDAYPELGSARQIFFRVSLVGLTALTTDVEFNLTMT
jgi:hypothetical protein